MMGERPHLDLCPSAHTKSPTWSGSCARRVQRRPPDGSAKCFGCLLVGCRRAATPADRFLVSRRARDRWRPRGHIEQFETAGRCERVCCSFALSRAIMLLSIACIGAGTCSRSFGLPRAANYGARSRHLDLLSRVRGGAKAPPAGHCERICCCFALSRTVRLLTIARGGAGTCSRSFGLPRAANYGARARLWLRSRGAPLCGLQRSKAAQFRGKRPARWPGRSGA